MFIFVFYRRSVRSGYAFAHQEGFGRLITSGKMMRQSHQQATNFQQVKEKKITKGQLILNLLFVSSNRPMNQRNFCKDVCPSL